MSTPLRARCSLFLTAAMAVLVAPSTAHAEGGPFGLGIILGQPTGLSGAYRVSEHTMIDAAVGLDVINDRSRLYIHADFLFVLGDLLGGGSVGLRPYLGPGAYVTANDFGVGARVPFGLSLEFRRAPLQIFIEAVPSLRLIDDIDLGIGAAAGFRYYF